MLERATLRDVEAQFGPQFAAGLRGLASGNWGGPLESGYGLHLVRVTERKAGRLPEMAQVRAAVERDLRAQRREAAAEALYRELRSRYTIVIEGK